MEKIITHRQNHLSKQYKKTVIYEFFIFG